VIVPGAAYYLLFQRNKTGILTEHAAEPISDDPTESHCDLQVASGQWSVAGGQ
jgi:hypothetical protein